jgi:hypothetical protein
MQRLEVSGAVRDIYIYIYDFNRLRVKKPYCDGSCDTVSMPYWKAPMVTWKLNVQLEKIWKVAVSLYSRYYHDICLEGLRNARVNLSQWSLWRVWYSNWEPPGCESETLRPNVISQAHRIQHCITRRHINHALPQWNTLTIASKI